MTPVGKTDIPALIDLNDRVKAVVIGSIKLVLGRLKKKGSIEKDTRYEDLLADPQKMFDFITAYKAAPDIAKDIALNKAGKPVQGLDESLVCDMSLAEIERLLVYTCAKRIWRKNAAQKDGETTPAPDKKHSFFGLFRRKDKSPGAASALGDVPPGIKAYIAFDWQLPLLERYADPQTKNHIESLGEAILALKTPQDLETITDMDPIAIRKAYDITGEQFHDLLDYNPNAIKGLKDINEETYKSMFDLIGHRTWGMFASDPEVLTELLMLRDDQVEALTPVMGDLCVETLNILLDIPEEILGPAVTSFGEVFGEKQPELLGNGDFAGSFMFDVVGSFRGSAQGADLDIGALGQTTALKWNSIKPQALEWLEEHKVS